MSISGCCCGKYGNTHSCGGTYFPSEKSSSSRPPNKPSFSIPEGTHTDSTTTDEKVVCHKTMFNGLKCFLITPTGVFKLPKNPSYDHSKHRSASLYGDS